VDFCGYHYGTEQGSRTELLIIAGYPETHVDSLSPRQETASASAPGSA
jgi:hypothetical protein